ILGNFHIFLMVSVMSKVIATQFRFPSNQRSKRSPLSNCRISTAARLKIGKT
ncbi:Hypothetical protein FKW44_016432, partial [Caligus rogercresseyi]